MATSLLIPGSNSLWSPDFQIAGDKPFIDPEKMRLDFDYRTPTVVVDTRQPTTSAPAKVDPLAAAREYNAMIAKRNEAARAAVLGRMRQQQEAGVVPYAPQNQQAAGDEIRKRLSMNQEGQATAVPRFVNTETVQTLQQRPTGGVVADYGGGNRVVTSRYGTGTATAGPRKGGMIIKEDGKSIPAAKWFQEAANRQNRVVDMGVGNDLYIPEQRQAEFAEGTRRLKAAETAAEAKAKARRV